MACLFIYYDRLFMHVEMISSDLSIKINRDFFKAVTVSVLLYGCTTWPLTKGMEKKAR